MTAKPTRIGGSNRLLNAKDVADMLGYKVDTVYDDWREWRLPGFYIKRSLKFRERDVEAWIEQRQREAA